MSSSFVSHPKMISGVVLSIRAASLALLLTDTRLLKLTMMATILSFCFGLSLDWDLFDFCAPRGRREFDIMLGRALGEEARGVVSRLSGSKSRLLLSKSLKEFESSMGWFKKGGVRLGASQTWHTQAKLSLSWV